MKTPTSANHHLDVPSLARFEPSFLDNDFDRPYSSKLYNLRANPPWRVQILLVAYYLVSVPRDYILRDVVS